MDFHSLKQSLSDAPDAGLVFEFSSGKRLASHFHVTEVGKVSKDFVDCGGVRRSLETCVLQTLVAHDVDHRLVSSKLLGILEKSGLLGVAESTEVEVETQGETIETYSLASVAAVDKALVFKLQSKQTACLATDKCGLDVLPVANESSCCGGSSECC